MAKTFRQLPCLETCKVSNRGGLVPTKSIEKFTCKNVDIATMCILPVLAGISILGCLYCQCRKGGKKKRSK